MQAYCISYIKSHFRFICLGTNFTNGSRRGGGIFRLISEIKLQILCILFSLYQKINFLYQYLKQHYFQYQRVIFFFFIYCTFVADIKNKHLILIQNKCLISIVFVRNVPDTLASYREIMFALLHGLYQSTSLVQTRKYLKRKCYLIYHWAVCSMFTVNIPKEVEKMRTVWSLNFLKPLQRLVIFPLFIAISHFKYMYYSRCT